MVRSAVWRVSNHEAMIIGLILRDAACAAPQDEGREVARDVSGDVAWSSFIHDVWRCAISAASRCPESAAIDSSENPRLASVDETPAPFHRKFFYCQKSRLRVRKASLRAHSSMSCNVVRITITGIANNENHYGNSVCCDSDNPIHASRADFLRRCANVFRELRSSRVARSRLRASILP